MESLAAWSSCDEAEYRLRVARLALDEAFDSIVVHRPDGQLVDFNRAAAKSMGLAEDEFAALEPWGWTTAPRDIIDMRVEELIRIGRLRFVSETDDHGRRVVTEVHARYIESDDGPLVVSVIRDITEKERAEQSLRDLAFSDPLTGVANRALLDERIKAAMTTSRRYGDLLGVAFMDIDDFKPVNDRYGHEFGDRALCVVADRLVACVREEDTVARVGGDEFVIVFPRIVSAEALEAVGMKLVDAVAAPIDLAGERIQISASVGLSLYDSSFDDHQSIVARADLAMYEAKRAGLKVTHLEKTS